MTDGSVAPAKSVTLGDVCKFFSIPLNKFRAEWGQLTDQDKNQIKAGLADETFNY